MQTIKDVTSCNGKTIRTTPRLVRITPSVKMTEIGRFVRPLPGSILTFLLFSFIVVKGECSTKTWKYDVDITNPDNWIGGAFSSGCEGTIFSPVNTAPVLIDKLSTGELVLPRDGEIDLPDGAWIEFSSTSKQCVKLRPLDYHDWYDFDSWKGESTNAAVPDLEKIPCVHDEVRFPKGGSSRVGLFRTLSSRDTRVRSMKFGDVYESRLGLRYFLGTDSGRRVFKRNWDDSPRLTIVPDVCGDVTGCVCHEEFVPCRVRSGDRVAPSGCEEPVMPHGFCHEICGAYLVFEPKGAFNIEDIREKLRGYDSDSHVSKIRDGLVQIVFAENEGYSGDALYDAKDLYSDLQSQKSTVKNLILKESGAYYIPGTIWGTISLLFGSLFMVLLLFAGIFYYYGETNFDLELRRVNLRSGSLFNTSFFARFDNTDENLIIDQSRAGSVVSLARSFHNPMFGQGRGDAPAVGASETSSDDEGDVTRRNGQEMVEKVNPLYDVSLKSVKEAEE